jgi:hypothetical protein
MQGILIEDHAIMIATRKLSVSQYVFRLCLVLVAIMPCNAASPPSPVQAEAPSDVHFFFVQITERDSCKLQIEQNSGLGEFLL